MSAVRRPVREDVDRGDPCTCVPRVTPLHRGTRFRQVRPGTLVVSPIPVPSHARHLEPGVHGSERGPHEEALGILEPLLHLWFHRFAPKRPAARLHPRKPPRHRSNTTARVIKTLRAGNTQPAKQANRTHATIGGFPLPLGGRCVFSDGTRWARSQRPHESKEPRAGHPWPSCFHSLWTTGPPRPAPLLVFGQRRSLLAVWRKAFHSARL